MERGDIEHALSMLKTVTPDKPYYIQAKEKMAALYLNHSKDHRLYIACFKELADKMPGSPTALLLGDAHMNIQEVGRMLAQMFRSQEFCVQIGLPTGAKGLETATVQGYCFCLHSKSKITQGILPPLPLPPSPPPRKCFC